MPAALAVEVDAGALMKGLENVTIRKIMIAAIAAAVLLLAVKLILVVTDRALDRVQMEQPVKRLVRGTVKLLLIFVAIIVVLGCLDIPVTSLVAVLSVAGLALSLALQNFLSNVAGGFQILASHPFKLGDWVEAGGCSGTVVEIGLFYTKLNSIDNRLIQLPNSTVVSGNIVNFSSEELRRVELKVSASYKSDPELVRRTLTGLVSAHPLVLDDREILVHVFAYQESDIQYIVRAWCRNADYWTVYFDLMDTLKPTLDKAGVELTYPHINVHMIER